jgi:hypothetical protein
MSVACSRPQPASPPPACATANPCRAGAETPPPVEAGDQLVGVSRTNDELMNGRASFDPEKTAAKAIDIPLESGNWGLKDLVSSAAPEGTAAFRSDLVFVAATGRGVPDTMGAVGPAQYVIALNSVIRSFDKATGRPDGVLDISLSAFFSGGGLSVCCDPKIRFDRISGRWFIGAMGAGGRQGLLAVSDGSVLTRSSRWTFFGFQQDLVPPAGDPGCAVDYTRMSVDAHAVYFVFGLYNSALTARCPTNPTGSTAFVVRKSSVLGAGPLVATAFRGVGYFSVPVDQFDAISSVGYITSVFHPSQSGSFYRVLDPGGTPTLSAEIPYSGVANARARSYIRPVRHRGSLAETGEPGNDAGRLFLGNATSHSVPLRNGRLWVGDLWGIDHQGNIQTLPNGGSTATRNGLSFVEVRDVHSTPTVVQSGVLFTRSTANDFDQRSYLIPALMVNGQGHLVLSGSAAGTNEYVNGAFGGRLATDPPGTVRDPTLFTQASAAYNGPTYPGSGTYRWGDYSNISLDPTDDMTIWTVQQAAVGGDVWGIVVARIRAPGPPPAASASPATLTQAIAAEPITVTGAPVDGEGFFDPGPGFAGRLRVSIDGGIGVRRVSFVSPTSLELEVSTSCAANGAHALTIVNPDGQSVTIPGFLTTNISPAPVRTVPDAPILTGLATGNLVSLEWGAAPAGCEATSFVLEAGSSPGASNLHVGSMGSARSFAASVPNGVYYVRVRGVNDRGTSPPSNELVLHVGVTPVPGAPSGLAATVAGQMVSLSWLPPTAGGPVQSYLIEAGTAPGQANIGSFPVTGSAFQSTGVPPGAYFVRVRAQNAGGVGPASNEVVVSVGSLPGAPSNLTATVAPGGRVTLTWVAPVAGAAVVGYRLEAGAGAGQSNLAVMTLAANATSFVTTGVPSGTYHVRIAAVGGSATGPPSNEVVVVVP